VGRGRSSARLDRRLLPLPVGLDPACSRGSKGTKGEVGSVGHGGPPRDRGSPPSHTPPDALSPRSRAAEGPNMDNLPADSDFHLRAPPSWPRPLGGAPLSPLVLPSRLQEGIKPPGWQLHRDHWAPGEKGGFPLQNRPLRSPGGKAAGGGRGTLS
jgi:hypothetical protein